MEAVLSQRVHELIENGWEPQTATETTAALTGRQPFAWWLFLLVIFLFPLIGGLLYLIFWLATSKATVFFHVENGDVELSGDEWMIALQDALRAGRIMLSARYCKGYIFSNALARGFHRSNL